MNQRQRRQQIRERRQACLANRRAGTRSPKPFSLYEWTLVADAAMSRDVADSPCCWKHMNTLKRLQRHLMKAHGMSGDYTGWLDFEAEYMAAVLGV